MHIRIYPKREKDHFTNIRMANTKTSIFPSEEKVWQKHYAPGALEQLAKKLPDESLWKLISTAMKEDNDQHDALVYFGRHIKRSTMLAEVEKWARVLKGMGLGVGDQILLFSPASPESYYVLFAADTVGVTAIMPNMSASKEALEKYYAQAKVAFVFDGMEEQLTHVLKKPQFKYVVLMDVTVSMRSPLKQLLGAANWLKTRGVRNRDAKYMTMRQAIERFGAYEGEVEAPYQEDRVAMVFSSGGTTKAGEAKLICMTDKAMIEMFRCALAFNMRGLPFNPGNTSLCQLPPFVCTGLFVLVLPPLLRGMTVYLEPRLNQQTFNDSVLKLRPNITLVPGPLWAGLFKEVESRLEKGEQVDLSNFVLPIMGGEGCTPEKLAWMDKLARQCHSNTGIVSGYGMSEVFSVISVDHRPDVVDKSSDKLAISVGYPFPGFTVGIFDKQGNELPYGQRGELWVKTPTHLAGYLDNGKLQLDMNSDGWIHTGDLCELSEDGLVYIYGRMAKNVKSTENEPVYLFDISNRLRQDKAVKESLAVAIDSEKITSPRVVAHLILEKGEEMTYELVKRLDDDLKSWLPSGVEVQGYKLQHESFKMSFVCKTDATAYGKEHDGYVKPVDGRLEPVSFQ